MPSKDVCVVPEYTVFVVVKASMNYLARFWLQLFCPLYQAGAVGFAELPDQGCTRLIQITLPPVNFVNVTGCARCIGTYSHVPRGASQHQKETQAVFFSGQNFVLVSPLAETADVFGVLSRESSELVLSRVQ